MAKLRNSLQNMLQPIKPPNRTFNNWTELEQQVLNIAEQGGGGYVGGKGIDLQGNEINAKIDGTSIKFDSQGRLTSSATSEAVQDVKINNVSVVGLDRIAEIKSDQLEYAGAPRKLRIKANSVTDSNLAPEIKVGNLINLITNRKDNVVNAINENRRLIDALQGVVSVKVVASKPAIPQNNTLYFVGTEPPYEEWLYTANDGWTELGTTEIDLEDYQKKEDLRLYTMNKTIVGAINEIFDKTGLEIFRDPSELSTEWKLYAGETTTYKDYEFINGHIYKDTRSGAATWYPLGTVEGGKTLYTKITPALHMSTPAYTDEACTIRAIDDFGHQPMSIKREPGHPTEFIAVAINGMVAEYKWDVLQGSVESSPVDAYEFEETPPDNKTIVDYSGKLEVAIDENTIIYSEEEENIQVNPDLSINSLETAERISTFHIDAYEAEISQVQSDDIEVSNILKGKVIQGVRSVSAPRGVFEEADVTTKLTANDIDTQTLEVNKRSTLNTATVNTIEVNTRLISDGSAELANLDVSGMTTLASGKITETPVEDEDIVNKKYVDEVTGGKLYIHALSMTWDNQVGPYATFLVITKSSTPFTYANFAKWLTDHGHKNRFSTYPITYRGGDNYEHSAGCFSPANNNNIWIADHVQGREKAVTPSGTYGFVDTVSELT